MDSFCVATNDGTGIAYMQFADDNIADNRMEKMGGMLVHGGSAYDGIYFSAAIGEGMGHWDIDTTNYIAFDSARGVITKLIEVSDIIEKVKTMVETEDLNKGIGNSFTSKLEEAESKITKDKTKAAIKQLGAFINHVKALRGKKLTYEQADELVEAAQSIIDRLYEEWGAGKQVASDGESDEESLLPESYNLSQNSPNPFNPVTTIQYTIPSGKTEHVSLKVYDMRGALVRNLVNHETGPGVYSVVWDGTDETGSKVSSGVYVYMLRAGEFTNSKKMLFVR